jgi:ankyrin repeat protein
MSNAIPLPPRPDLEQYRKLGKDFQHACNSGESAAIRSWAFRWLENVARLRGVEIDADARRRMEFEAHRMAGCWLDFRKKKEATGRCTLAEAQFFVARGHGFKSWPKFAKHLEGLARADSPVSHFEAAVDAIVAGDLPGLEELLRRHPELVRARSTREHRSTPLHYVSANGVEDFRQFTPPNIVDVARLLLRAGAEVNAESDAYGGRSTTLGLTATSCHPEAAGVQLQLMELLIEHGALIDGPDSGSGVNACLHNGRRQAAEFLAARGARLDLEGAAGVGRLDVVKSFVHADGTLKPPATEQQRRDGFTWACEFGRTAVIDFLLPNIELEAKLRHHGQTGLHWAAYGGHRDSVRLLLDRGAPVHVRDDAHNGTPLDWALYAWETSAGKEAARRQAFYEVVALLARAGATLDSSWYEEDEDRHRAAVRMRSDARMQAALRGEMP